MHTDGVSVQSLRERDDQEPRVSVGTSMISPTLGSEYCQGVRLEIVPFFLVSELVR